MSFVDDLVVHGSPEACWEHVQRYVDAGVTTVMVAMVGSGPDVLDAARALGGPGAARRR